MEKLKSKIAIVTGASSGIGASIVRDLLAAGLIVIGLARRVERVEELKSRLANDDERNRLHALKCDVSNASEVQEVFSKIADNFGPIHVLVNNAGCLRTGQLCSMPAEQVQDVLQTNIMGVVNCTRHAFAAMQAHSIDGYVILINSIAGHKVPVIPGYVPNLAIYPATKFALTAMNEVYRQEFRELGTNIKVTSISPGLVDTDLVSENTKQICGCKILEPKDVSRAVLFVLSSPPHVHIYELIMKPAGDII